MSTDLTDPDELLEIAHEFRNLAKDNLETNPELAQKATEVTAHLEQLADMTDQDQ